MGQDGGPRVEWNRLNSRSLYRCDIPSDSRSSTQTRGRAPRPWRASSPPVRRKPSPPLSGSPSAAARRRSSRCTCWPRCSSRPTASPGPLLTAVGADPADVRAKTEAALRRMPSVSGATVSAPVAVPRAAPGHQRRGEQASALGDEYVSTEHLLVGLAGSEGEAGNVLTGSGATRDTLLAAFRTVRGNRKADDRRPGGHLPGAGEVRRRPHPAGPRREDRPGHRPGHRDPPRRPGAVPADQEQPGADR